MKAVILVERNKHVRQFISRELQTMGYGVRSFKNGKEFLEELPTTASGDPIIIDRELADMDIHQAIAAIRQHRPHQPIIVHTFDDENGFAHDNNLFVARKQSDLGDLIMTLGQVWKIESMNERENRGWRQRTDQDDNKMAW
ncbi:response regulator [Desulfoplanes formicivorans]|uniref:Response regulatory domain-containing protein n=1 Tax=Desulfoplanes formicivorans TaxID=1592317 RepID=A0A194AKA1_9BACT|nr:response regulator [Desulfoplanes formicivorans]GAU09743.1 hypothetical protein DPF_2475 [Desulfoplanes formicivorans]